MVAASTVLENYVSFLVVVGNSCQSTDSNELHNLRGFDFGLTTFIREWRDFALLYSYCSFTKPTPMLWHDCGLFRIGGPGLGNLLFPWARFIIKSKSYNLEPIQPTWPQIKIGPLLRGESDLRFYFRLFRGKRDYISGVKKHVLLRKLPVYLEDALDSFGSRKDLQLNRDSIVLFYGLKDYFKSILREHEVIKRELLSIVQTFHIPPQSTCKMVAIHIRLGDFLIADIGTPLTWYVDVVRMLLSFLPRDIDFGVFSDGTGPQLEPILSLSPRIRKVSFGSSVSDILAMSNSLALIGTSQSTFSQWGSFLGRMPVIWRKGIASQHLYYDRPEAEIEFPCSELSLARWLTLIL